MSLQTFTLAEKIDAIDRIIEGLRENLGRDHNVVVMLKAVVVDLRARQDLPRNNVLGELERALDRMKQSKTALGYDEGKLIAVANVVIHNWPLISQALEQFGEESAE